MAAVGLNGFDVAFAVVVLAAVVMGYRLGGAGMVAKLAGYVLSIVLAGRLSGPLVDWADGQAGIVARLGHRIGSSLPMPPEVGSIPAGGFSPDLINSVADQLPLPAPLIEQLSRQMASLTAGAASQSLSELLVGLVARSLLQAAAFLLIATVVALVIRRLAAALTRLLERIPVAAKTNRLVGAALSLGAAVVAIALLLGLIAPVLALGPTGAAARALQGSRVAAWLQPVHSRVLGLLLNGGGLTGGRGGEARSPRQPMTPAEAGLRVGIVTDPDSDALAVAAVPNGNGMVLLKGPDASAPWPAAAILQAPGGPPGLFHFGAGGHVTALESAGWTVRFANHTDSTVDITLQQPDGATTTFPGMPYERLAAPPAATRSWLPSLGPAVAHAEALSGLDSDEVKLILRSTGTAIGGASCTLSLISATGTAGALTPLAVVGCGSHFINVISTLTDTSDLGVVSTAMDDVSCRFGDIPSCVSSGLGKLADLLPDWKAVYEHLTVSGQAFDAESQAPLDGILVRVRTTSGRLVGTGHPEYRAYSGPRYVGGEAGTAITNRWGTFEIRDIDDGAYTIEISKQGYVTQIYRMAVLPDRVKIVNAASGRQILDQDWRDIGLVRLLPALEKASDLYDGVWSGRAEDNTGDPDCGGGGLRLEISGTQVAGGADADAGYTLRIHATVSENGQLEGGFAAGAYDSATFSGQLDAADGTGSGTWRSDEGCGGTFTLTR